jgi:hypothetical protein
MCKGICEREAEREICLKIDSYFCSATKMCTLNGLSESGNILVHESTHISKALFATFNILLALLSIYYR